MTRLILSLGLSVALGCRPCPITDTESYAGLTEEDLEDPLGDGPMEASEMTCQDVCSAVHGDDLFSSCEDAEPEGDDVVAARCVYGHFDDPDCG